MTAWPPRAWWLIGSLAAGLGFVALLPWLIRPLLRILLWPRYGFKLVGRSRVPKTGPVLLASNHVTWLDGFFLAAVSPRGGRALVNSAYIDWPILRTLARHVGIIPIPYQGPRALKSAITAVQAALDRGEAVLIFPEGQLSRNGLLGPFYRGLEVMTKGRAEVPVVPIYLDQVWGSLFSHSGGRFFRKRPQGWRRRVVVVFGAPLPPPITVFDVRQAVQATSVLAAEHAPRAARLPETVDPALPHWEHPTLGLLSVSTLDYELGDICQVGQKPGTVGQAPPGVALRIVDDAGRPLPAEVEGWIQALLPGRDGWIETDRLGWLDRDGFLRHCGPDPPA